MNYSKLYYKFIKDCKTNSPRERLIRRNPKDYRLDYSELYTEKHHITPRHAGGGDEPENLVPLLPEEHLFAHRILHRAFGMKEDMFAVKFMINGMKNKISIGCYDEIPRVTKALYRYYAFIREASYKLRVEGDYHSEEGRQSISKARKGKMPCKCVITGKKVGSLPVDHPKVLSGEYVHITKGRKIGEAERSSLSKRSSGNSNPRYSNITDEEIISFYERLCLHYGKLVPIGFLRRVWLSYYGNRLPAIHPGSFRFDGTGMKYLKTFVSQKHTNLEEVSQYAKIFSNHRIKEEELKNVVNRIFGRS
jgi:hypothetical protein